MQLDIKPIQISGLNCFESFLITLGAHYNREYLLAFCDTFCFEYLPDSREFKGLLGDRIDVSKNNITENLKKYTGISFSEHKSKSAQKTFEIIKQNVLNNLPTGIYIETYWCPWHVGYQRLNDGHYCLAIGFDADNNIICIDPGLSLKIYTLPYNDFLHGYGDYVTFNIAKVQENIDYNIVLKNSINNVLKSNIFNNISLFRSDFSTKLIFSEELKNMNISAWNVSILRNLIYVSGSRFLFSLYLQYISDKIHSSILQEFSCKLLYSKGKWDTFRTLITKSYYTEFTEKTKIKLTSLLNDIIVIEKETLRGLYEFVYKNNLIDDKGITCEHSFNSIPSTCNYTYVDLIPYLNNTAIHNTASCNCCADFNGVGEYFLLDKKTSNNLLYSGKFKFSFPINANNDLDNLTCNNQTIFIPLGKYSHILFLACSEFGSFVEYVRLNYICGEYSDITINITDSWYDIPHFDNQVYWSGKVFNKYSNMIYEKKNNIFAFCRQIPSSTSIESITLPNCSNIHVFAITLISLPPKP